MKEEFIYNPKGEDAWEEKQRLEREKRLKYDKRYYAKNRENIIERNRLWNNSHLERMKELREQVVFCEACNKNVRKYLLSQHVDTKKHKRNLKLVKS
jgi:hypothetical protein